MRPRLHWLDLSGPASRRLRLRPVPVVPYIRGDGYRQLVLAVAARFMSKRLWLNPPSESGASPCQVLKATNRLVGRATARTDKTAMPFRNLILVVAARPILRRHRPVQTDMDSGHLTQVRTRIAHTCLTA